MPDLPISKKNAQKVARWLKSHYGDAIKAAVTPPFTLDVMCGIVCQESAIYWVKFIDQLTPDEILAFCVFDASGDAPNAPRKAFPKNTAAFKAKYGDAFTNMLIAEANKMRARRGLQPKQWVYKGYGIFQYDLQKVDHDEAFFRQKEWYDFDKCLDRAVRELNEKFAAKKDLWKAVKAYNGSGPKATQYANNVKIFTGYCSEVDAE
jgi:hypothetical protein